jgi:hypothetical protein
MECKWNGLIGIMVYYALLPFLSSVFLSLCPCRVPLSSLQRSKGQPQLDGRTASGRHHGRTGDTRIDAHEEGTGSTVVLSPPSPLDSSGNATAHKQRHRPSDAMVRDSLPHSAAASALVPSLLSRLCWRTLGEPPLPPLFPSHRRRQ